MRAAGCLILILLFIGCEDARNPQNLDSGPDHSAGEAPDSNDVPKCGNGEIDTDEVCDDAGESEVCDDDCTEAICGDGTLNVIAGEKCDDAGESLSCDDDCSLVECGDGLVNTTAGEACDDSGESLSCDTDCSWVECGDGLINTLTGIYAPATSLTCTHAAPPSIAARYCSSFRAPQQCSATCAGVVL